MGIAKRRLQRTSTHLPSINNDNDNFYALPGTLVCVTRIKSDWTEDRVAVRYSAGCQQKV